MFSKASVFGLATGSWSWSTFEIAAVNVVLPWSICPMVPMLTCGLVRSNLAFATWAPSGFVATRLRGAYFLTCDVLGRTAVRPKFCGCPRSGQTAGTRVPAESAITPSAGRSSLAAGLLNDLVGDVLRHLGVGVELHRVAGLTRGLGAEIADVAEHLR